MQQLQCDMSKNKGKKIEASTKLIWNAKQIDTDLPSAIEALKEALHFSILITYAQGLALLTKASKEYDYDLNLETIAKIWRGGCIIRSVALEDFRQAYAKNGELKNILLDDGIAKTLNENQSSLRTTVQFAVQKGYPLQV
jgi:6-phosphogluconate dehydrogenase